MLRRRRRADGTHPPGVPRGSPRARAPAAAADEAPPSAESADAGVRVLRSLRETEAAAWTQLEAFGGHPRQLELATAVCEQMLIGKQSAAAGTSVREMLEGVLKAVDERNRVVPLSERLVEGWRDALAPADDTPPAEKTKAAAGAKITAMLRHLCGVQGAPRRARRRRTSGRGAKAKLLLAACAALRRRRRPPPTTPPRRPPPTKPRAARRGSDASGEPEVAATGSDALGEYGRAAVLSARADAPAMLLRAARSSATSTKDGGGRRRQ